jgi:hypothetical protein
MLDDALDRSATGLNETYEPPSITTLGSLAELTQVVSSSVHDESDRQLKDDVRQLERPLERLHEIRTR